MTVHSAYRILTTQTLGDYREGIPALAERIEANWRGGKSKRNTRTAIKARFLFNIYFGHALLLL